MASLWSCATLLLVLLDFGKADINMHNLRGSNNRLNENTRPRTNANRLFNSQNNNRGGHNVGEDPLYFLTGSKLKIQWASQHSCGDQNNNCEHVLQYMCGDHIRDGTTTTTIPNRHTSCRNRDCDTDERFGQHEKLQYYRNCESRQRNNGLFVADQKPQASSRSTRQNPAGQRSGLECSEERDYYPYWGFSPWKDIAILTNNVERCPYYLAESQNVKERSECVLPKEYWERQSAANLVLFPTKTTCEASKVKVGSTTYTGKWITHPSHGIPPPDCIESQWSRDNHQGNTYGGQFPTYEWTIPDIPEEIHENEIKCVFRIRYNISTNDFDSWKVDSSFNKDLPDIRERFGLSAAEAAARGYVYKTNPTLDIFKNWRENRQFVLQLALNTAQYGRTFQDRSHTFRIRRRPKNLEGAVIHNLNVRGKRGNIVQVFPSVEYDFAPGTLHVAKNDYVHPQWTGSNTNPANNAGQGKAGTDRSNIVKLRGRSFPKGMNLNGNLSLATNYPSNLTNLFGFHWKHTEDLAFLERCTGPDPLLDNKDAYFDLGPQKITSRGTHYYFCTRNNQFSNRNQKARLIIGDSGYDRNDGGVSYRGFVSTTTAGETCKYWDSPILGFNHKYNSAKYKNEGLISNFCRNPEGAHDLPWCYVNDSDDEWEYCEVTPYPEKVSVSKRSIEDEEMELAMIPNTDFDQLSLDD